MKVDKHLEQYIENNSTTEGALLQELEKETFRKTSHPTMISGYLQGRLLAMISKILQPKSILEIGTFTGYASLCLAEGLCENGALITLDCNPETEPISAKYFSQSKFSTQINYLKGNAMEILPTLKGSFDLIFLDADKENYSHYYTLLKPKMKKNSVLLVDNVLWYGKVVEEKNEDSQTQFLKDFNTMVKQDTDMETLILPIRDGISIIRKK